MIQTVATLVSSMLAMGALALIASFLAQDWRMVVRAIRNNRQFHPLPLPVQARVTLHDRRARVISVRSQSVPQRAAA
jgi:hypothetical protein